MTKDPLRVARLQSLQSFVGHSKHASKGAHLLNYATSGYTTTDYIETLLLVITECIPSAYGLYLTWKIKQCVKFQKFTKTS